MTRGVIYGVLAGFGMAVLSIILISLISVPEQTAARAPSIGWKLVTEHYITQSLMVAGWALACASVTSTSRTSWSRRTAA